MSRMPYSNLTRLLRRVHSAIRRSQATGASPQEILEQDRELRRQLAIGYAERRERRRFLKTAGLAGAAVGLGGLATAVHGINNSRKVGRDPGRVAIIGAGGGGLRTAHRLQQYGWPSKVYEASDRVGGRMYSNSDYFSDGRTVEWGGELISTEHTSLRNLAHQLNLDLEDVNKSSVGEEEVYLIDGTLYSEADLLDEWLGGLYTLFKRAEQEAPWQPFYYDFNDKHLEYDWTEAGDWLVQNGIDRGYWAHKLLMSDLISEYGLIDNNSALNLIYLLGWSTRNSGGLPLAGTDERFHVVGGNDQVVHRMAAELPEGTIELAKQLVAVRGDVAGPYTLSFSDKSRVVCDQLVFAMPYHLIREVDIDRSIWQAFSEPKRAAIERIKPADSGKVQIELASRYYDMVRFISGEPVHLSAVSYSDPGTRKDPGFISTWEGNPKSPSEKGIIVNYTGGYAGETLGRAGPIPGAMSPYFGEAARADVQRVLADFETIWPGIAGEFTGKALVSNWWDYPYSHGAFVSPDIGAMTTWWGAQWEREGNIHFAGEACDPEHWSYMDGAIRSGEAAAKAVAQA
jgi:monoamine oxidase